MARPAREPGTGSRAADGRTRTIRTWRSPMPSWPRSKRTSASTRIASSRTGWSYGGSMSYRTACERPLGGGQRLHPRHRRVLGIAAQRPRARPASRSRITRLTAPPIRCCNYSNGVTLAQNFAMANGCTWATPTKVTSGNHVCTDLMGCMSGYPAQFCSFNGDHTPDPQGRVGGELGISERLDVLQPVLRARAGFRSPRYCTWTK